MKDLKTNTTPDVTLAGELRSWAPSTTMTGTRRCRADHQQPPPLAGDPMNQLPFSPLTLSGLGVLIEEHASVVTHAITQGRQLEPHVRAEASLVLDLCQARTNRVLFNGAVTAA